MGAEPRGSSSVWFPRSDRAAQRHRLNQIRATFAHAQAVFDEYQVTRPRIPEPEPIS